MNSFIPVHCRSRFLLDSWLHLRSSPLCIDTGSCLLCWSILYFHCTQLYWCNTHLYRHTIHLDTRRRTNIRMSNRLWSCREFSKHPYWHTKLPSVLAHTALLEHVVLREHSSMSKQLPCMVVKPVWQPQIKLPTVFVQCNSPQYRIFEAHSSKSLQVCMYRENPPLHLKSPALQNFLFWAGIKFISHVSNIIIKHIMMHAIPICLKYSRLLFL